MDRTARLDAAIDAALGARIVGCVVMLNQGGRTVYARAAGWADREAGRAMTLDAVFRLASVTKPVVATAVLRLCDQGRLGLDTAVTDYLPWFTPPGPDGSRPVITLRQLLTHTSGITYAVPDTVSRGMSGPILPLEENLRRLAQVPLAFDPGTRWDYGMGIDVLGGVVAAVEGTDLGTALARLVTGPLGMVDTGFVARDPARLTAAYADATPPLRMADPQLVRNDPEPPTLFSPGRILTPDAPQSGGAGLAGTAADVMRLLEVYHGGDFLSETSRRAALADQIGALPRRADDLGKRFGLIGAVLVDPLAAASPCPTGTVDWGGAWGHNWILDPVGEISLVTCTNTAFEGCNGAFRDEIRDAVYA